MRHFVLVSLALALAMPAYGQDARVAFLVKQLQAAKDPRVKTQTVLLLGQTASADAVGPLCQSLSDSELVVRTAAANALSELKQPSSLECLKTALTVNDTGFHAALEKAIASVSPAAASGKASTLYIHVEPIVDKVGLGEQTALVETLLREQLTDLGASFAPENEDKKTARAVIKLKKLKGYQLRLQLLPGATEKALKVEMLVMTYPEQALQGSWNVKASGGNAEALIRAMLPRVIEDAADDLNWKAEGAH